MFLRHSYTSISHFWSVCPLFVRPSVCPSIHLSVHWFVTKLFLRLSVASLKVFLAVIVCSSVCLPDFSESADARDFSPFSLFVASFPFQAWPMIWLILVSVIGGIFILIYFHLLIQQRFKFGVSHSLQHFWCHAVLSSLS